MKTKLASLIAVCFTLATHVVFAGEVKLEINMENVVHESGFAYKYVLPSTLRCIPDSVAGADKSNGWMSEDGMTLDRHSSLELIRTEGYGLTRHWVDEKSTEAYLLFSSSDNSDPRTSGRYYQFQCWE